MWCVFAVPANMCVCSDPPCARRCVGALRAICSLLWRAREQRSFKTHVPYTKMCTYNILHTYNTYFWYRMYNFILCCARERVSLRIDIYLFFSFFVGNFMVNFCWCVCFFFVLAAGANALREQTANLLTEYMAIQMVDRRHTDDT